VDKKIEEQQLTVDEKRARAMKKANEQMKEMGKVVEENLLEEENEEEEKKCLQEWLEDYKVEILNPGKANDLEIDLTKNEFLDLLGRVTIRIKHDSKLRKEWNV